MTEIGIIGEEIMDAGASYSSNELVEGQEAYMEDWEQSCSQPCSQPLVLT